MFHVVTFVILKVYLKFRRGVLRVTETSKHDEEGARASHSRAGIRNELGIRDVLLKDE
jgi:hypothetical protein